MAFFGNVSGHRWPLIGVISSLSVPVGGFFGFVGAFRCLFWFHRCLFLAMSVAIGGCHRCLSVPVGGFRWIFWFCRCLSVPFLVSSVAFFGNVGGHRWLSSVPVGGFFGFVAAFQCLLSMVFFGNVGGHRWLSRLGLFGPALVAMLWVLEILGRKQAGEPLYKYIYIDYSIYIYLKYIYIYVHIYIFIYLLNMQKMVNLESFLYIFLRFRSIYFYQALKFGGA